MDRTTTPANPHPAPNHHADHPGFAGLGGLVAAVGFLAGRGRAADLAIELAALRARDRLVDVGCGPGVAVQRAHSAGAEAIGVDPAPVMLRVARARWRRQPGVEWRLGAAEDLPVDDGWATVAWSLSTVHHWADVEAGLRELARVVAPGGRVVALERRIGDPGAHGVASHGWTPEQAEAFAARCREHGFVDVEVTTHRAPGAVLAVVGTRADARA